MAVNNATAASHSQASVHRSQQSTQKATGAGETSKANSGPQAADIQKLQEMLKSLTEGQQAKSGQEAGGAGGGKEAGGAGGGKEAGGAGGAGGGSLEELLKMLMQLLQQLQQQQQGQTQGGQTGGETAGGPAPVGGATGA